MGWAAIQSVKVWQRPRREEGHREVSTPVGLVGREAESWGIARRGGE